jgi:hypothetical protein
MGIPKCPSPYNPRNGQHKWIYKPATADRERGAYCMGCDANWDKLRRAETKRMNDARKQPFTQKLAEASIAFLVLTEIAQRAKVKQMTVTLQDDGTYEATFVMLPMCATMNVEVKDGTTVIKEEP